MDNISIEQIEGEKNNILIIYCMRIDPCMKKDLTW